MDTQYIDALSSKSSTGGGSAAAYTGVLAAACTIKVFNLMIGKEEFASIEYWLENNLKQTKLCRDRLIELVDEDTKAFDGLAATWKMSKEDPNYLDIKEKAILYACDVPIEIMEKCIDVMLLNTSLAGYASKLVAPDVGVAAKLLVAAIGSASFNVRINADMLHNIAYKKHNKLITSYKDYATSLINSSKEYENIIMQRINAKI